MSYELYPVHCLYHGDIISEDNYKELSIDNQKKFAKSNRPINCYITEDKDDKHLSISELYSKWRERMDKENDWMIKTMPDNIESSG